MRVKMLTTAHGPKLAHCHHEGQVYEVADELAQAWIDGRHAELAPADKSSAKSADNSAADSADDADKTKSDDSTFTKLTGRSGNPRKEKSAKSAKSAAAVPVPDDAGAADEAS